MSTHHLPLPSYLDYDGNFQSWPLTLPLTSPLFSRVHNPTRAAIPNSWALLPYLSQLNPLALSSKGAGECYIWTHSRNAIDITTYLPHSWLWDKKLICTYLKLSPTTAFLSSQSIKIHAGKLPRECTQSLYQSARFNLLWQLSSSQCSLA
jgi:hypothetical protein